MNNFQMKGTLRIVRGNDIKFTLPAEHAQIKTDGTIWYHDLPILGITDPEIKAKVAADLKAKRYDRIPADAWVRLGYNDNGVWAGDDEAWAAHPAKLVKDTQDAIKREQERKQVTIYLSSCGWGDYSPVEWIGDITRPDAEILAECKTGLATGYDVDQLNQTDTEILDKITTAREKWETAPARKAAREAAEAADIENKIKTGYCFNCESWCHGDCGNYSNDPRVKFNRDLKNAQREANYGITE